MKKITLLLLLISISAVDLSYSQAISLKAESADELRKIPSEEIFIHYNNPLLFAGEYLYYKLYCYLPAMDELSDLSKVAYVELINSNKEVVFRHKLRLQNGTGNGDFFIPVTIPSGNYKLIGYTTWMANNREKTFFSEDLVLLNPYRGNPHNNNSSENGNFNADSVSVAQVPSERIEKSENRILDLILDAPSYDKRVPVTITLSAEVLNKAYGNYSLSVRRKDPLEKAFSSIVSAELKQPNDHMPSSGNIDSVHLPELRGEILSGKIIAANEDNNLKGLQVGLSIPGDNSLIKVAGTDSQGNFLFHLGKNFTGENALLEVLGEKNNRFNILVDSGRVVDYSSLRFQDLNLMPEMEEMILKRSVYNQVENGYYSVKPDTILQNEPVKPFFGDHIVTYNLDDYTRFETIKETLIEIVKFAKIVTNPEGEDEFRIRGYQSANLYDTAPLLIVDGAILQDQNKIINYGAKKVKSIGIIRDRYFYGPAVFNGVINIETLNGDFFPQTNNDAVSKFKLLPYQQEKAFFKQNYSEAGQEKSRIPDYRLQLLWEPSLIMNSAQKEITFFTSDVSGEFEISLEGYSFDGQPVSIKKDFIVE